MAETYTIPAPSFVHSNPEIHPTAPNTASPPQATTKDEPKASQSSGVTKRKQSKSRNGCVTCKAKRLKCDETKPTCQQCFKRAVTCGGYKKDFKWRPFEEASFAGKQAVKSRKCSTQPCPTFGPIRTDPINFYGTHHGLTNSGKDVYCSPHEPNLPTMYGSPIITTFSQASRPLVENMFTMSQPSPYMITPQSISPVKSHATDSTEASLNFFGAESIPTLQNTASSSVSSGKSPRLVDLLLPGTDIRILPEENPSFCYQHDTFDHFTSFSPPAEDVVKETCCNVSPDHEARIMWLPSPSPSRSSSSSPDSQDFRLLKQPQFSSAAPESLTRRYHRDTCGILSVKDGPTENPWRTLVWPLANDCPALYHAIASMTSFHQSIESPAMRIQGIDHFRAAVHALAEGLQDMHFDAAISTTLVLAFSESWDQHIRTGINHIKGAKLLIDRALVQHRRMPKQGKEWTRFKFLCNTWIYMDVIARLTSANEDDSNDVDIIHKSIHSDNEIDTSLDPLMGCADTLFPIIGRVASLVKKIRRSKRNGLDTISQAMQLKAQLEKWTVPSFIEDPEDKTMNACDSVKTATAYQYATLLYLHQAVPEIPSPPSIMLAKKVLSELATIEPKSRSTIVHIYPLMAAGCEATTEDDRNWVRARWMLLASRMKLGTIDKSLQVTQEVWSRRDAFTAKRRTTDYSQSEGFAVNTSAKCEFDASSRECADGGIPWLAASHTHQMLSTRPACTASSLGFQPNNSRDDGELLFSEAELLEPEFTVKGCLHWLGVMKDWNWEVLLG